MAWHRQEEGEVQRWAGLSLGPNRLRALETQRGWSLRDSWGQQESAQSRLWS